MKQKENDIRERKSHINQSDGHGWRTAIDECQSKYANHRNNQTDRIKCFSQRQFANELNREHFVRYKSGQYREYDVQYKWQNRYETILFYIFNSIISLE